jgi:hypothetical protein
MKKSFNIFPSWIIPNWHRKKFLLQDEIGDILNTLNNFSEGFL